MNHPSAHNVGPHQLELSSPFKPRVLLEGVGGELPNLAMPRSHKAGSVATRTERVSIFGDEERFDPERINGEQEGPLPNVD